MRDGNTITFFVAGEPKTAGSKRAFKHKTTGRIVVIDDSGKAGKAWREAVKAETKSIWCGPPFDVPLRLHLVFVLPRPKSHYRTGQYAGKIKDGAPHVPSTRPDATKLLRAVEDAMTGIAYEDDALIVWQLVEKCFAGDRHNLNKVGVQVTIKVF